MAETIATIAHGSPAGYDLGCKSAGGCPNHGSAEWLTCKEAAAARRGDFALTKLPLDEPISRKAREIPKTPKRVAPTPTPTTAPTEPAPMPARAIASKPARAIAAKPKRITAPKSPRRAPAPVARSTETIRTPRRVTQPKVRTPREEVHGTVYGWRRGCRTAEDCPSALAGGKSCTEVKREYYADYRAARRAGAGPEIKHGTASGYQLGCHDRATCPGGADGTTCADASLEAERRRRRARGIPEQRRVVDSKPAIEHIATLRAAGMPITEIISRSGVGRTAIRTLIYGRDDYTPHGPGPRHREIPAHIEQRKAEQILAVQPSRTVQLRGEPRRLQEAS